MPVSIMNSIYTQTARILTADILPNSYLCLLPPTFKLITFNTSFVCIFYN